MKYVYLFRHAKSSWDDYSLSDLERPLNKRGKRDAPFMGKLLKKMKISPDLILTSPAERALGTAKIIAEALDYPEKKIIIDNTIYGASPGDIVNILSRTEHNINSVMIFGHNPTFTTVVNLLSNANIDNLPTCSITAIEFPVDDWSGIQPHTGRVKFYEYPKKYLSK